jgi:hypothetical protein
VSPLLAAETEALTREGISPARATQAIAVQGEVAQADLVSKVEDVMAGAFAGVWFESAEAKLHIGVTSPASRLMAEGVLTRAGLGADVALTPVRSTWAQLIAAQSQWNRKLAGLFAGEKAKTALTPQFNSVFVTLSSSVPSSERAVLEREASAADVNVLVAVVPPSQLRVVRQAQTACNTFVTNEAYCNKPITSGVTIQSKSAICTAGPMAISTKGEPSETYLLTAGHCTGVIGDSWFALNRNKEKGEIGKAVESTNNKQADFGEITIDQPGAWAEEGNDPVFADTAEWKRTENKSYPVKGEREAVVGNTTCHEGQTTGESCGQIKAVKVEGTGTEGLVETKGADGEAGDSGGPWLFIEKNNEARMEGTHVGGSSGKKVTLYYEPLKTTLNALSLELLTTANEVRPGEGGGGC